jgi:hypothetical protein
MNALGNTPWTTCAPIGEGEKQMIRFEGRENLG